MITKTFHMTLDTKRSVVESPIVVVKGDNGNVFVLKLQDNGTDLSLTGATVIVAFRGAGGSYTQDTETGGVTVSGSTVTVPVYKDAVSEGTNSCDVQIYTGSGTSATLVTTAAFTFECRAATVGEDTIEADASLPILLELIDEMNEAVEKYPTVTVSEITGGHRITVTNYSGTAVTCDVLDGEQGVSGVYVGSGSMPTGYNVQIDPTGTTASFIEEPASEGTSGQVLTTDGAGGRSWTTVSGGTGDYTALTNKPSVNSVTLSGNKTSADLGLAAASHTHSDKISEPASEGTSGQVLATNGSGTRYWKTVSGGSGTSDHAELDNLDYANSGHTGFQASISSPSDIGAAAASHTHTKSEVTDFPTNVSSFTNDAGYLTEHQSLSAYRTSADQDTIDSGKQATLVSGTNIKTVNSTSLLGSGNIVTTPVLLWTNSDTTESFAAQDVTVNLSAYRFILLVTRYSTSAEVRCCDIIPKGYTAVPTLKGISNTTLVSRACTPNSTSVTFGTGYNGTSSSSSYAIPDKIYGIK